MINLMANRLSVPIFTLFLGLSLLFSFLAYAAFTPLSENMPPTPSVLEVHPKTGPTTLTDWYTILKDVVGWLFVIAIVVAVAVFIIAGLMYITSQGAARAATAQKIIIYTIVGVAVVALAWAIVNLVGNFFVGQTLVS